MGRFCILPYKNTILTGILYLSGLSASFPDMAKLRLRLHPKIINNTNKGRIMPNQSKFSKLNAAEKAINEKNDPQRKAPIKKDEQAEKTTPQAKS